MRPPRLAATALGVAALCLGASAGAAAQSQDHQYAPAEIQAGGRLYAAHCQLCHGESGGRVAGIDLRRGPFRRAASDEELRRGIANGTAGGRGSPPSARQPAGRDARAA